MGRHRYTACVRSDGLLATVGPLLDRRRVVAATLVDISSGFLLDGYSHDSDLPDLELLGAAHADLARTAAVLAGTIPGGDDELVVSRDQRYHHVLRPVVDPHEDLLALSVVVRGTHRQALRARWHLRQVSIAGLTAGPAIDRRTGGSWTPSWDTDPSGIPVTAPASDPAGPPGPPGAGDAGAPPSVRPRPGGASPPSAMVPMVPPPGQVRSR